VVLITTLQIGARVTKIFVKESSIMAKAKKKMTKKVPVSKDNCDGSVRSKVISIPPLTQETIGLRLVGDRPLLVNNKTGMAKILDDIYGNDGKKTGTPHRKPSNDELYVWAFYTMPKSKFPAPSPKGLYGIPASGIKKCVDAAIRTTGITDNTTIGSIGKSFFVLADDGGLCQLKYKRLERDVRVVNTGSGQKSVPTMRHRPMFYDWSVDVRVRYNPKIMSPEQLINLFMHAGAYIGWGEMRAQKKQGECGGFYVTTFNP